MGRRRVIRIVTVGLLVGFAAALSVQRAAHTSPPAHEFTLVNVEVNGTKFWLPSVIVAHPGEKVTLKLQNKLDAPHGFAIDDYGIKAVVPQSGETQVTFTARRGRTSRFYCQLHAAHIGGQVIVVP